MLGLIVSFFSKRGRKSQNLFDVLIALSKLFYSLRGKQIEFDSSRFKDAAWVKEPRNIIPGNFSKNFDLIMVSTTKDFDILPYSIKSAINSLSRYSLGKIYVIVPSKDVPLCVSSLDKFNLHVEVIDEATLVNVTQFKKITASFKSRDTWVLQQLLKVQAVLSSEADAVLILDSDTVLLKERAWFDAFGAQLLTPTYEFNRAYYEFLAKLGTSNRVPKYTFVSHHMVMQPNILRSLFNSVGWDDLDDLIDYSCKNAELNLMSPISLDYELYGQSLVGLTPKNYYLGKWANLNISRSLAKYILDNQYVLALLRFNYNSISFHSWN